MMEWVDVSIPLLIDAVEYQTDFILDGFFDAGMLLHALKGVNAERDQRFTPEKRRFVGKKLHLNEY